MNQQNPLPQELQGLGIARPIQYGVLAILNADNLVGQKVEMIMALWPTYICREDARQWVSIWQGLKKKK